LAFFFGGFIQRPKSLKHNELISLLVAQETKTKFKIRLGFLAVFFRWVYPNPGVWVCESWNRTWSDICVDSQGGAVADHRDRSSVGWAAAETRATTQSQPRWRCTREERAQNAASRVDRAAAHAAVGCLHVCRHRHSLLAQTFNLLGRIDCCSASDSVHYYTILRSVVCLSVVCLSHSCPLLKPLDRFRSHLAGTLMGSSDTFCYMRSMIPREGRFGVQPPAKTCNCKLQPNRQSYAATWRIQTRR